MQNDLLCIGSLPGCPDQSGRTLRLLPLVVLPCKRACLSISTRKTLHHSFPSIAAFAVRSWACRASLPKSTVSGVYAPGKSSSRRAEAISTLLNRSYVQVRGRANSSITDLPVTPESAKERGANVVVGSLIGALSEDDRAQREVSEDTAASPLRRVPPHDAVLLRALLHPTARQTPLSLPPLTAAATPSPGHGLLTLSTTLLAHPGGPDQLSLYSHARRLGAQGLCPAAPAGGDSKKRVLSHR